MFNKISQLATCLSPEIKIIQDNTGPSVSFSSVYLKLAKIKWEEEHKINRANK